jgi:MFS family permease
MAGTRNWAKLTFDSLRVRDFKFLWIGMLLSMGGMQMQMFTRGLQAFDLTGSGLVTALVAMGWAPTMLAFSLFGGVLGERLERRSLIQFAQISNAVLPAISGVLTLTGVVHWSHLFIISMIQGLMFATQMPARQAVIPTLVGRERVSNALALNATGMGLMNIIGPALAGLLYDGVGPGWSYVIGATVGMAAVWFTMQIPKMYPDKRDGPRRSTVASIGDGLRYILKSPLVMVLLIQGVAVTLLAMPFRMLIQVFAQDVYGASAAQIGVLGAVAGVGAVIGALWIAGLRLCWPQGCPGMAWGWRRWRWPVLASLAGCRSGSRS